MTKKSDAPAIRFKGFSDAWEQRKLGDCFAERVESMPDGELISVTINDGIKKFSELGRHDNSNDDKSKYKKVCIGDIAYNSMRMWQGASGYSPYEGIVSPAYTVLSPNSGINSKCLAYQFKLPEMIHTFQINSQGITSDNWNLKYPALSEIEIFVSRNEKEQAKIAEYFEWLDRLITLHQRKCKIRNLRCPKSTAITWEQRKVAELGKIYIGLVTTMTAHYTDEGTLLIRNSDIKDGRFEFGEKPIFLEKSFAMANESRMHQIGDVITVHTGDVGTSAVISENEDKSIGFATIVTRPNKTIIDPSYLCTFLNTERHKKWAVAISTGDGRTNYNLGDYFELVVPVPSIKEQKQIAMFIENLNNLITLHQRKQKQKSPPITASLVIYGSICFDCFMSVSNTS